MMVPRPAIGGVAIVGTGRIRMPGHRTAVERHDFIPAATQRKSGHWRRRQAVYTGIRLLLGPMASKGGERGRLLKKIDGDQAGKAPHDDVPRDLVFLEQADEIGGRDAEDVRLVESDDSGYPAGLVAEQRRPTEKTVRNDNTTSARRVRSHPQGKTEAARSSRCTLRGPDRRAHKECPPRTPIEEWQPRRCARAFRWKLPFRSDTSARIAREKGCSGVAWRDALLSASEVALSLMWMIAK